MDKPAEIQVSMCATCEEGLGGTRSYIASQCVTADKPDTTAEFPVSQEIVIECNPNLTPNPNPPPHSINRQVYNFSASTAFTKYALS